MLYITYEIFLRKSKILFLLFVAESLPPQHVNVSIKKNVL